MSNESAAERVEFLGLEFDQVTERRALELIACLSHEISFAYVVTPNVDHLVRLHSNGSDSGMWASYRAASLCICDSRVLQRLAALSGIALAAVPGSDLTARLLNQHLHEYRSVAVIGGDSAMIGELRRRYAACKWYHHLAPMGVRNDLAAQNAIIEFVQGCEANLFLFAIGSPQSELLCCEIRRRGAQGVGLCIGASLEFLSGAKKRAPRWMQRHSLEWLFRLLCEPRRLWRRYLIEGPAIFRVWWQSRATPVPGHEACDSTRSDGIQ